MKKFIYTLQYINQYVHIHELVKTTNSDIYASYKNCTGVYFITLNNLHNTTCINIYWLNQPINFYYD